MIQNSTMARFIYQVYIADGFADDCEELMHRCSQHESISYQQFTDIWKEMEMDNIYLGRYIGAEIAELSEEVLQTAKRYMLANTSNFEESVAGLFLVYALLNTQPFKTFAPLRLVPDDVIVLKRIETVARRQRRLDVLYILGSVLMGGPVHCHAESREYGFDQALRKYLEGFTGIDRLGIRPKGVFYRQNEELDVIRDISHKTKEYEHLKSMIYDENGQNDVNLKYADKDLPLKLETSLKRIINGLLDDDKDEKELSAENERIDRIRAIKARAMTNTVDPIKHLTAHYDRKVKQKGKGKGKKAKKTPSPRKADDSSPATGGSVKVNSPRKPVTSKSPKKHKLTEPKTPKAKTPKAKTPKTKTPEAKTSKAQTPKDKTTKAKTPKKTKSKRRKKRNVSTSESSESDATIVLSDFDDDVDDEIHSDDNIDTYIAKYKNYDENAHSSQRIDENMKIINQQGLNIEELAEKEYNVHIDTLPILIKGDTSQDFVIEFIDQTKTGRKRGRPRKVIKARNVTPKATRTETATEQVTETEKRTEEESTANEANETQNCNLEVEAILTPVRPVHYRLRRRDKSELKAQALKSKFKKMGLVSLINGDGST